MNTLVINCGSSSIKYALIDGRDNVLMSGKHERLGQSEADGIETHASAVKQILDEVRNLANPAIS